MRVCVRGAVDLCGVTTGQVEAVFTMEQHLLLVTLFNRERNKTEHECLMCLCAYVCSHKTEDVSHRAGVDCEGTLDEVELQYAGLQGGVGRCDHLLLLLLLLLPSFLLFVRDHP